MARITEKLFINGEDNTGPAVRSAVKGQEKLGKSTKAAGQTMAQSAVRFRTAVLQVAAAVGVYKAVGFAAELLRAADNIEKVADKVGLTTDELQELRFAAELVNVNTTALDMGMQRFSRRLGEAAQGMGELMGIAKQYNIQLRDSSGRMRNNIDVLEDFADVIQNAESDQERLRIAFKLFDSEGAALVNIFKEGSAGLTTMRIKAQELGIVVEEDLIRNAAIAQDELTILSKVINAQLTTAVAELAPEIAAAATAMTKLVLTVADGVGVIKDFFTQTKGEEMLRLEGLLQGFTEAVVRNKRILAGEGGFFESLGLTKVHERNLRESEAAVVRITERLNKLNAERRQEEEPQRRRGGGGGVDTPATAKEIANQKQVNTILEQLRRADELSQLNSEERKLAQLDLAAQDRTERLLDLGATDAQIREAFILDADARDRARQQQRLDDMAMNFQTERDLFQQNNADAMALEQERFNSVAALNEEELAQAQALAQTKQALAQMTAGNATALLNELGKKNKTAALAALVLTKGLAIAQTISWGSVAAMHARALLGPGPGDIEAARIKLITAANVGLISALGLLQASSIASGGGGGGGGGGPAGGGRGGGRGAPGPGRGPQQQAITIRIVSDVKRSDDFIQTITSEIVQDATDQRNPIMITTTEN